MISFETPFSRQANSEPERAHWSEIELDRWRSKRVQPHNAPSDVVIEEAIWDVILKDRSLGPRYQENIAVDVEHGRVKLRGHVEKPWHSALITDLAEAIAGVVWVRNELVSDDIVQQRAIRALLQDEKTSPYIFTVRSHFGWVHIGGLVPTPEIARTAEGVVGFIPMVRGILGLPSVFSVTWLGAAEPEPVRRTWQPRLASAVYQDTAQQDDNEESQPAAVGLVSQVLIDPTSRLVGAFAVRVSAKEVDGEQPCERLVPMTAVEAANARGVWLKEGEQVSQYAPFERSKFPLPPPNWRPPFPYQTGEVRWGM